MSKKVLTDTWHSDTAVELSGVSKIYTQWQREAAGNGIIKNFLKPDKKIIKALDGVSFTVKRGEFAAYAGPNGAGKSTTMKLLCGMLAPNEGTVNVFGISPVRERIKLMNRVGVLFGNRTELWWDHPVLQSFEWKKAVWDIPEAVYKKNLSLAVDLLDIGEILKTFARELSLGQRLRADLAMMLLHSPELILLDEPTLGLDVVAKRSMIDFLKKLNRDEGVTIMVTSHDMDDLEEMARRIIMISDGKLAFDGSFDSLRTETGIPSRVSITMSGGSKPDIASGTLISSDKGVFEYGLDANKIDIRTLLSEISAIEGVRDVEIKKAPIEQVIASLYRSWK